jgi:hypothetical protein
MRSSAGGESHAYWRGVSSGWRDGLQRQAVIKLGTILHLSRSDHVRI